jgi:ferric-dicitrate binding protein FerR (iron transport regulator)
MSSTTPTDHERVRDLMMAALDDEVGAAEHAELLARLDADPELRGEWERLQHLKELTKMSKISTPPEEVWGNYWRNVYNRLERSLGWILVTLSAVVLAGWGMWEGLTALLADTGVPLFAKVAILALGLGGVILLFSVIREKLFTYRHDPFKEVER